MVAVVVSGAVVVAHMAPEPLGVMGAGWGVDGDLGGSTPVEYLKRDWDPLLPLPMSQAAPDSAHGAHAGALGGSSSTHEVGWLPHSSARRIWALSV